MLDRRGRVSYGCAMAECQLIRGGESFRGKQGLDYFAGGSAETSGATGICMHIVDLPPGASAVSHHHAAHETAILLLEGIVEMRHGPDLEQLMRIEAGDFIYIPAGVPHQPYNPTDRSARGVLARTDPNKQDRVVLID